MKSSDGALKPDWTNKQRSQYRQDHGIRRAASVIQRLNRKFQLMDKSIKGEVPPNLGMQTFFGMLGGAMFVVWILSGLSLITLLGIPFFPFGLCKILSWLPDSLTKSHELVYPVAVAGYLAYIGICMLFSFVKKWRWYWVGFSIFLCLLVINIDGCYDVVKHPFHGPE